MSDPIRAIIVDDEPLAREELGFLLSECEGLEVVGTAPDAETALSLSEEELPEVAFVDLRMQGIDGITLAETLRARQPEMSVVVVSAHDDGALRAYDAEVVDYLLKPVRLERLRSTVERLRSIHHARVGQVLERIAVRRRNAYVVVHVRDIVYFETRDDLVWAVTKNDRFGIDLTLASLERRLSDDMFFRSHRGAIVRLDHIRAIESIAAGSYELVLDHPEQPRVPLARDRMRTLRQRMPFTG